MRQGPVCPYCDWLGNDWLDYQQICVRRSHCTPTAQACIVQARRNRQLQNDIMREMKEILDAPPPSH